MPLHLKIFNQVVEVIIIIIMKEFIVRLLQCGHKPITTCCSVLPPEIIMHDAYIGGRFRRTKTTRKASDAAENLQLYRTVRFFHQRSSCTTTHISADVQRITLMCRARRSRVEEPNNSIPGIFCCITGFTSDFLSFIVVELIQIFHRAIQLL